MSRYLIEQIDESQDGSPLRKYIDTIFDGVKWGEFSDPADMSMTDALNLLLLKIASGGCAVDDMEYVQKQLGGAALVVFNEGIREQGGTPNKVEWKPLQNVVQASGLCPVCGGPDHDMDCR